jgi:hypothetical protein
MAAEVSIIAPHGSGRMPTHTMPVPMPKRIDMV